MIRTISMIRVDDGKTADVHPDEVENWKPFGWTIDEARIQAQLEEDARIERDAAEHARAESERQAAEEEAQRRAEEDVAAAARQALGNGVMAPQQSEESTAAQPGSSDQGEVSPEQANTGAGTGAGAISTTTAGEQLLTVAKGPRGLFFVKAGDAIVSKGFATEEEATVAIAEVGACDQK